MCVSMDSVFITELDIPSLQCKAERQYICTHSLSLRCTCCLKVCVRVWAACLSCQNVLIRLTADPNQGKERKRARDRGNTSERNARRVPMNSQGEKASWAEKGNALFSLSGSRKADLTSKPRCRGLRTLGTAPILLGRSQGSLTYRKTAFDSICPVSNRFC